MTTSMSVLIDFLRNMGSHIFQFILRILDILFNNIYLQKINLLCTSAVIASSIILRGIYNLNSFLF